MTITDEKIKQITGKKIHPSQITYFCDDEQQIVFLKFKRKRKLYVLGVPYKELEDDTMDKK